MHLIGHSGHEGHETHAAVAAQEAPLDILKRRFALGEITRDQFEEMSQALARADSFAYEHRSGR